MSQFVPAQSHKLVDSTSYDATAVEFDKLTERFSTPLAQRMVELAGLRSTDRVLDVGTGTGLVALIASKQADRGSVVGIDHSDGMLGLARSKAAALGATHRVQFEAMDAEALDLKPEAFDAVLSLFLLLHLPNPAAAVREMHRVLAPGGRLVVAVGGGPSIPSVAAFHAGVERIRSIVSNALGRQYEAPRFLQRLMSQNGFNGREHHASYRRSLDVRGTLEAAGFSNIKSSWTGRVLELTEEEFWDVQAVYGSSERIALGNLSAEELGQLKGEFLARARRMRSRGGRLLYRYAAKFYVATRT